MRKKRNVTKHLSGWNRGRGRTDYMHTKTVNIKQDDAKINNSKSGSQMTTTQEKRKKLYILAEYE